MTSASFGLVICKPAALFRAGGRGLQWEPQLGVHVLASHTHPTSLAPPSPLLWDTFAG